MKKFLSLVLALVMTMSLVTISAGAEFKDADSIDYKEAVDVIAALDIVGGSNGNFMPEGTLTRGAAAKIICNVLLGIDVADTLSANSAPFVDVPANSTFAKYIAYCKQEGIIGGYGDGTFRPSNKVTGFQFLKMLLGALGYDSEAESFIGANYTINVAKLASQRGLMDGIDTFVGAQNISREVAAQLVFNTLKSKTVSYSGSGQVITIGNVTIEDKGTADIDGNYLYLTNFSKLSLDGVTAVATNSKGMLTWDANDTDDYGRAAYSWYLEKTANNVNNYSETAGDKLIGKYAETADLTLTVTKSGKTLAYWLETLDKDYTVAGLRVNGAANANSMNLGDEVEVYLTDGDVSAVIVNKTALVKVGKVTAVDAEDYDYTVKVGTTTYTDDELPGFDADTMVKDTWVLVVYKQNTKDVLSIEVAPYVTGVMTAAGSDYIKVDGDKLLTKNGYSVPDSYKNTYNFYMDNNDYVLGHELVEEEESNDGFVYLMDAATKAYAGTGLGINGNEAAVKVKVAHVDGTVETVDYEIKQADADIAVSATCPTAIDKNDYYIEIKGVKYEVAGDGTNNALSSYLVTNAFYAYSKTEDGKIVLKALDTDTDTIGTADADTIKKNNATVDGSYIANSSTKLVVIDTADKQAAEFVGYKNFPETAITSGSNLLIVHAKNSTVADVVYAIDNVTTNDVTYAYYTGDYETRDSKTYYDFYVNGETVTYELGSAPANGKGVYTVNETAKTSTPVASAKAGIVDSIDDNYFVTVTNGGTNVLYYADNYKVWDISGDVIAAGEVAEGDSIVYALNDSSKVAVVYVVKGYVAEQPATRNDAMVALAGSKNPHASWGVLPTVGLTQTVDGSTIYLSGELTDVLALEAADFAGYVTALNDNYFSGVSTTSDLKTLLQTSYGSNYSPATIEKAGFAMVEVNGYTNVLCVVGLSDGSVKTISSRANADFTAFTWQKDGVRVTIDIAGLSF